MRTQDEILQRIKDVRSRDYLGFCFEVLVQALDFKHVRPFLKEGVREEEWEYFRTHDEIRNAARRYLDFAWEKASGHRGISAGRSVDKLTEYAWLLGRNDIVQAMNDAEYAQYGVPKLVAFAKGMEFENLAEDPDCDDLHRMSQGLPCQDDCDQGCG